MHAKASPIVRYSGEFHWRPLVNNYWTGFQANALQDGQVDWELIIDNNSGTYAPNKALLPKVKELLEYNFPGLRVVALDYADPKLEESRANLRRYAAQHINSTTILKS
ncbi:hypothetical protein FRB94_002063 [Tulasnella sp. JGI-2019a]|nr:hypothetical protein FRB93_002864 [Tulasnella sp. JGI-2019a]KAG9004814.1 hypothetical protein FRB94_002063 [Tulasnella sp. JGI-2019a]KAG9035708.1 hypothetical protein FRB95_010773 [Tulasnella sp. JGI-2019a]